MKKIIHVKFNIGQEPYGLFLSIQPIEKQETLLEKYYPAAMGLILIGLIIWGNI